MKKLLDVTDRKTRLLQQLLMAACGLLTGLVVALVQADAISPIMAGVLATLTVVTFVVTAGIKQRWELDYRGHLIRFENSPIMAEKLYLDEGLVAKGGFGKKMELRAPIRVGEGAGDTLVALADAGVRTFRLRLFVEGGDAEGDTHPATFVQTRSQPSAPDQKAIEATEELRPVTQSVVLGKFHLAKYALELLASLIGVIGGLIAIATWLS